MEDTTTTQAVVVSAEEKSATADTATQGGERSRGGRGQRSGGRDGGRGQGRGGRGNREEREPKEFDQQTLELARVTRVTSGGKRMRFRAAIVIGDRKGRVGFGVAKGADVQMSMNKAVHQAKKNLFTIALVNGSFAHRSLGHFGPADVLLMPAPKGTGLKSGGAVRMILELAGVQDAVSKILGSSNKINVAKATFQALQFLSATSGTVTDADREVSERKERRAAAASKVVRRKIAEETPSTT